MALHAAKGGRAGTQEQKYADSLQHIYPGRSEADKAKRLTIGKWYHSITKASGSGRTAKDLKEACASLDIHATPAEGKNKPTRPEIERALLKHPGLYVFPPLSNAHY